MSFLGIKKALAYDLPVPLFPDRSIALVSLYVFSDKSLDVSLLAAVL
jgi:hypothetical protein